MITIIEIKGSHHILTISCIGDDIENIKHLELSYTVQVFCKTVW